MDTPPSPHECKILPFTPAAALHDSDLPAADRRFEVPRRILLGTDLSIRCERALGRAAALSDEWDANFLVMYVADTAGDVAEPLSQSPWRRPDKRNLAWRTLLADVAAVTRNATVLMGEGAPGEVIAQTAAAERCDLVVLGMSQEALLGRVLLDRTADRVLRHVDVPVLVVKERPRKPYDHVVVATDFSAASRTALDAATTLFPESRLTVFHAYGSGPRGVGRRMALRDCDDFVSGSRLAQSRPPLRIVEEGWPPALLRDYGQAAAVDLVVLGMQKRSQIREIILGSIAKSILDQVTCDILVVPQTRHGRGGDDARRLDHADNGGETGKLGT